MSTGNTRSQLLTCDFCLEIRGRPSEFSRRYPTFADSCRIAGRSQNLFVVPTLGQLVEDHALIVSNEHITSSAQLSDIAMAEMATVLRQIQFSVNGKGKSHLVFEHGIPSETRNSGGCGISHCHVHSLPVLADHQAFGELEGFLERKGCSFRKRVLSSWTEITSLALESYLSVQLDGGGPTIFIFKQGQPVESQLMRQFVAANSPTSQSPWDWRLMTDEFEKLRMSCRRLAGVLSEAVV